MASENRFDGLMSGLNSAGAEEKPAEKVAKKLRKRRTAKQKPAAEISEAEIDDIAPTRRAKNEPKMARNRNPGNEVGLAKSKNPDYEKGTYYLPKELTHEMRVFATINRMEMSELVDKAMRAYLKNNPFTNS